jgi:hypothetical protein
MTADSDQSGAPHRGDATGTSDLVAAIQFVGDLFCTSCMRTVRGIPPIPSVRIVHISQADAASWLAHGEIRNEYCDSCGKAYQEVIRYIPVACAAFPCPTCGAGSRLTPAVLSISANELGYDFAASLKCGKCSKERRVSKLLRGLSKITRGIEPPGVRRSVLALMAPPFWIKKRFSRNGWWFLREVHFMPGDGQGVEAGEYLVVAQGNLDWADG